MKVENSLGIFFKNHICQVLFGMKTLRFCGVCEKIILDGNEINKGAEEAEQKSIQCDICGCWYHLKCQNKTIEEASNIKDEWLCTLCVQSLEK